MSYSFATDPLRGLAAVDPRQAQAQALLTPLTRSIRGGLDELVAEARDKAQQIANSVKMSWWQKLNPLEPSEAAVKQAATEWATNITNYAESVRTSLSRVDSTGQPLFIRKPDQAEQILRTAKRDLTELIRDFSDSAESTTFQASVSRIIDSMVSVVLQIAQIVVMAVASAVGKFPVGAVAVAGALGIGVFAYLKIMRVI